MVNSPLIRPYLSLFIGGGGIGGGTLGSHDIYAPENSHAIMEPQKMIKRNVDLEFGR